MRAAPGVYQDPSASAEFTARPVGILASDNGAPDPENWARVVAAGMVSVDPDMPEERRKIARQCRWALIGVLVEAFHEARAGTSKQDIVSMAASAAERCRAVFAGTPWEYHVGTLYVRAEFERYLMLNLAQAAHLNLVME